MMQLGIIRGKLLNSSLCVDLEVRSEEPELYSSTDAHANRKVHIEWHNFDAGSHNLTQVAGHFATQWNLNSEIRK